MKLGSTSVMLAGWLFADCMLGLMIVGLASDPGRPQLASAVASPSQAPTPKPTPLPGRTTAAAQADAGVAQRATVQQFDLRGKTDAQIQAVMRKRYARLQSTKRKAALVLTFGTATEPGEGVKSARRANALLRRAAPQVFSGSASRDFWQARNEQFPTSGVIRVEIYLFNTR